MDHIPKTYRDRRQEHSHTKRKQYDHRKRDHRQKYRPVQLRSRRYHHKQQRRKGCHQIDKTGHHPGKHEQVLRHIHFLIKEALLMIADIELVVESLKKLKIT
mgnify:CR=1 FL=1